jgi:hypothetical protein
VGEVIAEFVAYIPGIAGAFKVSGEGAGRLTLDIPESELPAVLRLMAFGRDQALKVTVHADPA